MKKTTYYFIALLLMIFTRGFSQSYVQYFDGADTSKYNSIIIHRDTSQNIWQIGAPHKHYFDSAYSRPNVIVTDTSIPYPTKNTSIFSFEVPFTFRAIYVIQWIQKLDMDSARDGGIVEFSLDTGRTWKNAFNSYPYVMSFYGYNLANKMVLPSGDTAFSGTDSTWKDIWLCLNLSTVFGLDSVYVRFRFTSDSINHNREGWMIDNMGAHLSILHPVNELKKDTYLNVYPRLTNGPIYIKAKYAGQGFKIQYADMINEIGQTVEHIKIGPGDSFIDISALPSGWYTLKVKTNMITKTYPVLLKKD